MGYKTAFAEVMREYERDRDRARADLENKRQEVYKNFPRILTIENQLKSISIKLARSILINGGDIKALDRLRRESEALMAEKKQILADSRFGVDFLDAAYRCPVCRDTGFVGSTRCMCLKQRLIQKYYDCSNLSGVLEQENFSTFDLRCYSVNTTDSEEMTPRARMKGILKVCREFVDRFGNGDNLLFYGKPGLGKTFMCNCLAKEILDKGATVLYSTAPRLFKAVEAFRFNRQEAGDPETIEALTEVDLLIIDDLGAEISTLVTASELFNILNARLLENRSIIISTNLSPADFQNQYSERIVSRFSGHFKMLKFIGDDIRIKKKYGEKRAAGLGR
ncbi:MAG: ATP-binding protein [Clostridiales bacterium]|jgi:DNA replication protein DnaC|nr:ATP-binding protein [Clostridiales bacterium]